MGAMWSKAERARSFGTVKSSPTRTKVFWCNLVQFGATEGLMHLDHAVEADAVTFGVLKNRNEAVLTDGGAGLDH
jgi:hypothetical protein